MKLIIGTLAALALVIALAVSITLVSYSPVQAFQGTQPPAEPAGLTTSAEPGSLEVSLDWSDTPGATQYRVRWRLPGPGQELNEGLTTASSDAVITVADYGEWLVRVDACNDAGCGPAATWTVTLMPEHAQNLTVSATPGELDVTANWDQAKGATSYQVGWRLMDGDIDANNQVTTTATSAAFTASGYGQWVVRVKACNDAGCAPDVAEAVVLTPARPGNLAVSATQGELDVTASWDEAKGATSYQVSWRQPSSAFEADDRVTTTDTSAAFTLSEYGEWIARVEGCNDDGCGPGANKQFAVEAASEPTPAPTPEPTTTPEPDPPAEPSGLRVSTTEGSLGVTASWSDTPGATQYLVRWRVAGPGNRLNEGITTTSSEAVITVSDYGRWVVRVEGCSDAGCGQGASRQFAVEAGPEPTPAPTPEPTATPTPEPTATPEPGTPAKPLGLRASAEPGSLDMSADWNDVAGADRYRVRWLYAAPNTTLSWQMDTRTSDAIARIPHAGNWTVKVEACNGNDCGEASLQVFQVTPSENVPAKPGGLKASTKRGSLDVSLDWDDVDGATRYAVWWQIPLGIQVHGEKQVRSSDAAITVGGYGKWMVRVAACNESGCGEAAAQEVQAEPAPQVKPPPAPAALGATAGDQKIELAWADPSDTAISKYQYRVSDDDGATWDPDWTDVPDSGADTNSFTVTGLTNDTAYTVELRAVRGQNTAGASGSVAATTPPPAPAALGATAGDQKIELAWADPSDTAISKYQYRVSDDDGATWDPDWTDIPDSGADTTSFTVTGLTNDTAYTVELRAVRGQNTAGASGSVAATTPPPAPAALGATAGDQQIELAWTDPSDTAISKYQYRVSDDDGATWDPDWTDIPDSGADTNSFTVTGLTNDTAYTVELRAVRGQNTAGASGSVAATPTLPPPAPAGLGATAGDQKIELAWTDPSDTAISKYQYRVSDDDGATWDPDWTDVPDSGADTTSFTVTGLTNDTAYTVELRAVRGQNTAGASGSVAATTPPPAPAALSATPGDERVKLRWAYPSDTAISKYQYRVSDDDGATWDPDWTDIPHSGAGTLSFTVTGLTNDTAYTIELRVVRGQDTTGASGSVAVTTPPLSAPSGLMTMLGDQKIGLRWDDPDNSDISKYQYRMVIGTGYNNRDRDASDWDPDWTDVPDSGADTTSFIVSGLTNGTEYVIELRAVTGQGAAGATSIISGLAGQPTAPSAPSGVKTLTGDQKLGLVWNQSSDPSITRYQYRVSDDWESTWDPDWTDVPDSGADTTPLIVTGLTNGTDYIIGLRAVRGLDGYGQSSGFFDGYGIPWKLDPPAAPSDLSATTGNQAVRLDWTQAGYGTSKYQYRVSDDDGTTWDPDWTDIPRIRHSPTAFLVTGLTNDTEYTIELRKYAGLETPGEAGRVTATPEVFEPPPAPSDFAATPSVVEDAPGELRVDLSWTDPSDTTISKYEYRVHYGEEPRSTGWRDILGSGADTTSFAIDSTGTSNPWVSDQFSNTYEVRAVRGVDAFGTAGRATVSLAPSGLAATPGDRKVALSWNYPSNSDITKYQYRVSDDAGATYTDWTDMPDSGAQTTSYTVTGLTNDTLHAVELRAAIGLATGWSSSTAATPEDFDAPPAPAGLAATPGNQKIVLSWTHPWDSDISKYRYRMSDDGGTTWDPDWSDIPGSGADTTSYHVIGLTNDTEYTVELRAVRGIDALGPAGSATATPTVFEAPPAPADLGGTGGDRTIALDWADPSDTTIGKYQYRVRKEASDLDVFAFDPEQGEWSGWADIAVSATTSSAGGAGAGAGANEQSAGVRSFTVSDLINLRDHSVELRAVRGADAAGQQASLTQAPAGFYFDRMGPGAVVMDGRLGWTWRYTGHEDNFDFKIRYKTWDQDTKSWSDYTDWTASTPYIWDAPLSGNDFSRMATLWQTGLTNGASYCAEARAESGTTITLLTTNGCEIARPYDPPTYNFDDGVKTGTAGDDFLVWGDMKGLGGDDVLIVPYYLYDQKSWSGWVLEETPPYYEGQGNLPFEIYGGDGDDILISSWGSRGSDYRTVDGGAGDDIIEGDGILKGGAGDDILVPINRWQIMDGGEGEDIVTFLNIIHSDGVTTDLSHTTDRLLDKDGETVQMDVYTGVEKLFGSLGNDNLTGDDNANDMNGSRGNDTLTGKGGADNFLFFFHNFEFEDDTITDFSLAATLAESDRIYLCPGTEVAIDDITISGADSGSDRVITVTYAGAQRGTITLEGITSSSDNFARLEIAIPDGTRATCDYSKTATSIYGNPRPWAFGHPWDPSRLQIEITFGYLYEGGLR